MIARFNSYREFETPMLYVCAPGCKYVDGMLTNTSGILTDVSDIEIIPTFNATSELNFRCYRVNREDAEENAHFYSLFRSLRNRRLIYVEDIGFFVITNVEDGYDLSIGTDYKDISCESCEEELRSKNIPYIDDGTYKFFTGEEGNPGMLEKLVQTTPLWYIGEVDTEVANRYRTFEDVDYTENVLGFMLEDLQNAYECIFVFDIQNRIINVYDQANYVHETDIHLTRDDLITGISVTESSDDLYTALSVTGEDELSINAVNPIGTNVIYNFDYYLDWMTPSLSAKVREWQELVASYSEQYYNLQMARYSGLTSLSTLNAERDQLNTQLTMYKRCRENMVAEASDEQIAEYNSVITSVGGTPIPEDLGYLWIMFGDDASGTNITTNPYGKRYIGLAWDKGTNVASNNASDYRWFTFRSGESFPRQKDGKTLYTWVVFADSVTSGMSNTPEDVASSTAKPYIGISVDNDSSTKSSVYDDYTWSLTNVGGISVSEALGTIDELIKQTEAAITAKDAEIAEGDEYMDTSEASVINIHNAVAMQGFFTEEELDELSNYIVEGTYSDDYIGITDSMSYSEVFEQMKTLYDRAVSQLKTVSVPTQQFTIDVENFIFIKEFERWSDQLETGCLINVELSEGDVAQLFLTSFEVNYEDKKLSMTFGNRYNRFDSKALFDKFLGNISRTQNTLSYIRSTIYPIKNGEFNQMKEALETSRTLTKNAVLSSTNEQVIIDDTGYTGRKLLPDGSIDPHQIKINGRNIVFTDDAWETCKTAIGEIILGSGEAKYGINAEIVLGNLIYGNELHIIDKDGKDMFQVTEDKIMLSIGDIYAEKADTISGVEVMYCRASSSTACNISTMTTPWSVTAPEWVDGEYIWQKTVTTYDDGHTSESAATCLSGSRGQAGRGILSTVIRYAKSSDGVNHPTNESDWYADIPDYAQGEYVWTRTVMTYTDNSTSTSYSVSRNGVNGDHNAVVYLYKRSGTQATIDWTNPIVYDFQLHTLSPIPSGWSTTVPAGVEALYVTAATASSKTQTDTIAYTEWSTPNALAQSGVNTAAVFLYKRADSASDIQQPTSSLTYTFADGSLDLSPLSITGHTVEAPDDNLVDNLFFTVGEVLRLTSSVTGTGYTYQWYYKTPNSSSFSPASDTSAKTQTYSITTQSYHDGYQFYCSVTDTYGNVTNTKVVRINAGKWSQNIPASDGTPCYVIQATAISINSTDAIEYTEWSTATKLVDDGIGISGTAITYATSTNGATPPQAASSWSGTFPGELEEGEYLWTKTVTTYTDGTDSTVYSVSRNGVIGHDGRGITHVSNRYATSTDSSTAPSVWVDTPPNLTPTNKYLWNYEIITYTDNTTDETERRIIGVYGDQGATGNGIDTITEYYLASPLDSGVTVATAGWTTTVQQVTGVNKYLWNYEVVTYTNGNSFTGTPAIIGMFSNGITSTSVQYAASNSGTSVPSSGWQSSVPSVSSGEYLWTRSTTTYTYGEPSISYSVSRNAVNGNHTAVVYLYKRSTSQVSIDWTTELTYSFQTNKLTSTPTGWSESVPSNSTDPIYMTAATASSNTDTDTIAYTEFAVPVLIAQNGSNGSNGSNGVNSATIFLYQRSSNPTTLTKPSGNLTYTFSTGTLEGSLGGWAQVIPDTDGTPCYVIQATAVNSEATDIILPSEWSDIRALVADGDGVGIESSAIAYATSNDGANPPTDDWSDIIPSDVGDKKFMWTRTTTNYTDGTQTVAYSVSSSGVGISEIITEYYLSTSNVELIAGEWSDTPPSWTSGTYIWTRSHLYWDNGDESTTTPVLDNSLNQLNADVYDCQTDIEVNKQGIQQNTQYYQELYGQVAKINAYIQTGVIGVDETGKSSFGVKIGENLSTVNAYIINGSVAFSEGWLSSTDGGVPLSPDESVLYQVQTPGSYFGKTYRWNGSTYSEAESEGTLSSIFTSSELGFYDTGEKTAYFSNKNLNVTTVRTTRILLSRDVISDVSSNNWQIGIDNGFYLKWVGAADGGSGDDTEEDTASTFTATSPVTNNTDACTITITRAKNTYIHSLQYSTDGSNWTTITASTTGESAISWTPNLTFTGSDTSISCTVRCITYKGSVAASNLVGSYDRIVVVNKESSVVAPTITSHPSNVTTAPGTTVTYGVIANGSDLTYNWQFELSNVSGYVNMSGYTSVYTDCYSGYDTATLTITDTTYFNGVNFRCVVTNSAGSVISNSASLTIQETVTAPTITSHPSDTTVDEDVDALFSVAATGTNLSYQWQSASSSSGTFSNVTNLTGYNTANLTVPGTSTYNGMAFRCVVTNSAGSATSNAATLTVQINMAPVITTQPTSTQINTNGGSATFSVTASGEDLSYTWYSRAGSQFAWGEMGAPYTTATIQLSDSRYYDRDFYCKVWNEYGSVDSDIVTLTSIDTPYITSQPTRSGNNYSISANGVLYYRWEYSSNGGTTFEYMGNATAVEKSNFVNYSSATVTVRNGIFNYYSTVYIRCRLINNSGETYSDPIQVVNTGS